MNNLFQLFLNLIIGNISVNTTEPARLGKKLTLNEKISLWFQRHEYEFLLLGLFIVMVLFVLAVFIFVPPMDMWNNHFNEVI
ncbi:MAG: hypothetical protein IJF83_00090 [Methanobrevibacter sp.]|nr:hypothetical protein [Methanobrevibacter sp.]